MKKCSITWNKYKNPFKTKLFIVCMLFIPITCFLIYGVYANLGGLFLSLQSYSKEQEKVVFVGLSNYKLFFSLFDAAGGGELLPINM